MKKYRSRRTLFVPIAALALALVSTAVRAGTEEAPDVSGHPWIGEAAPEFTLPTVAGGEASLADFRGKYLVIHFGTSW